MAPTPRRVGAAFAVAALGIGTLALSPGIATADALDESYLYTVDAADADAVADLDVISSDRNELVILGDARTDEELEELGVEPLTTELYADSIGSAAQNRLSAAAADDPAGYPLPERIADNRYETFFGGYRTVDAQEQFARDVAAAYPELVQLVDYGDSWLKTQNRGGRDLLALRITGDVADQPDYTDGQDGRPRFALIAQSHPREIITSELAWRYTTQLLNGYGTDAQSTALLNDTEVWVVLQHNPDGAELVETALSDPAVRLTAAGDGNPVNTSAAWQRKNVNDTDYVRTSTNWNSSHAGIDLNRNWANGWGGASTSSTPSAATYKGTAPHSEPEVAALSGLLTDLFGEYRVGETTAAPDDRSGTYVNLHSYSNYVIYPYAYNSTANVPNLEPLRASGFRQSAANNFATGKAGEILYDNAGNDIDWIYGELGVPAFTYEIGTAGTGGFFPSYTRVESFWSTVEPGISYAAEAAYEPYTAALGGVVSEVGAERTASGDITVTGVAT
ncbi:MAG: M14 family zinc carboxypeptidase, partial [Mycetocola sp.]